MNKDVVIVICILLAVGASVAAIAVIEKDRRIGKTLEEERYSRMVAEESSQKSAAKLATLEVQTRSAEEKMAKLKDILDQEKGVNVDLKSQYDKLAKSKGELEVKLQAALEEKASQGSSPQPAASAVPAATAAPVESK